MRCHPSTLNVETAGSSETLTSMHQTSWCHTPENTVQNLHAISVLLLRYNISCKNTRTDPMKSVEQSPLGKAKSLVWSSSTSAFTESKVSLPRWRVVQTSKLVPNVCIQAVCVETEYVSRFDSSFFSVLWIVLLFPPLKATKQLIICCSEPT